MHYYFKMAPTTASGKKKSTQFENTWDTNNISIYFMKTRLIVLYALSLFLLPLFMYLFDLIFSHHVGLYAFTMIVFTLFDQMHRYVD